MGVVAFSHLAVRVRILEHSLRFYRATLGFRDHSRLVVRDTPSFREAGLTDAEMVAWFLERDGTVVELQTVSSPSGAPIPEALVTPGYHHLAFRVAGVDATARTIEAGGGTIDWQTRTGNAEVGGEAVFGADPDGQRLEFLELAGGPEQPVGEPLPAGRTDATGIDRFDHIAVGVGDLARALDFYTGCLGGQVEADGDDAARVRIGRTSVVLDARLPLGIRHPAFVGDVTVVEPDGLAVVVGQTWQPGQ